MVQESGLHFKLLYDTIGVPNGYPVPCFILGTLYQTFTQRYPSNIVDNIQDDGFIYLYPIEISAATLDVVNIQLINLLPIEKLKEGKLKLLINLVHDPIDVYFELELYKFEEHMNSLGVDSSNLIFFLDS